MQIFLLAVWNLWKTLYGWHCVNAHCRFDVMICGMHCRVCLTIWNLWKTSDQHCVFTQCWSDVLNLWCALSGFFSCLVSLRKLSMESSTFFFLMFWCLCTWSCGGQCETFSPKGHELSMGASKSLWQLCTMEEGWMFGMCITTASQVPKCSNPSSTNDLLGLLTQSIVSSDYNLSGEELSITTEVESGRTSLAWGPWDLSRDVLPPSTTVSIARSSNELTLTQVSPSVKESPGTAELLSGMLPETSLSSSSACGDLESSCRCSRAGKKALGWKLSKCVSSRSCRRRRLLWPTAGWARMVWLVLGTIMALLSFASLVGLCRVKLGVACPGNVASEKSRSGNTEQRQWGHCTLSRSHSSIHAEWKLWAHGRPRTCHVQTQLGALLVFWDFSLSFYKVATNCHHKAAAKSWLHAFLPPTNSLIPLFYYQLHTSKSYMSPCIGIILFSIKWIEARTSVSTSNSSKQIGHALNWFPTLLRRNFGSCCMALSTLSLCSKHIWKVRRDERNKHRASEPPCYIQVCMTRPASSLYEKTFQ